MTDWPVASDGQDRVAIDGGGITLHDRVGGDRERREAVGPDLLQGRDPTTLKSTQVSPSRLVAS